MPREDGGGITSVSIFGAVTVVLIASSIYMGIHKVDEGHVGMYWRGGALLNAITEPGFHTMIPFVTSTANVQVTLQTDVVKNIPCGTSGGVMIYFETIEVVNKLRKESALKTIRNYGLNYDKVWIFDKIHHEINQFCSKHTLQQVYIDEFDSLDEALAQSLQQQCDKFDTGIDIIAIRVTKPKIPDAVMHNYLAVTEEKTKLLVAQQHQQLVQKEEETKRLAALVAAQREAEVSKVNAEKEALVAVIAQQRDANVSIIRLEKEVKEKETEAKKMAIETQTQSTRFKSEAEAEATVSKIKSEMELSMKEAEAKRASIDNRMYLEKQKALADAAQYTLQKEAEGLKVKLTPEYLRLVLYQSLSNNTKIYFGESIPKIFLEWANDNGSLTLKSPQKSGRRCETQPTNAKEG